MALSTCVPIHGSGGGKGTAHQVVDRSLMDRITDPNHASTRSPAGKVLTLHFAKQGHQPHLEPRDAANGGDGYRGCKIAGGDCHLTSVLTGNVLAADLGTQEEVVLAPVPGPGPAQVQPRRLCFKGTSRFLRPWGHSTPGVGSQSRHMSSAEY